MRVLRVSMFVHARACVLTFANARACPFVCGVCARACVCVLRVCIIVYERALCAECFVCVCLCASALGKTLCVRSHEAVWQRHRRARALQATS